MWPVGSWREQPSELQILLLYPSSESKKQHPLQQLEWILLDPLHVRSKGNATKCYIYLFTCAVTRAVHLEVVSDLTEKSFLQASRRFTSRKSLPYHMISDNASTYLAAADELKQLFQSPSLKDSLTRQGVEWQFIPKRAPWYGGFWERLIGLTKRTIK